MVREWWTRPAIGRKQRNLNACDFIAVLMCPSCSAKKQEVNIKIYSAIAEIY
jgi:hypothetical protein